MAVTVRDLGELSGQILLFGGPYSNLQALEALDARATDLGIPAVHRICTGDVMAYCADPVATWEMITRRFGPTLAGNCERQIAARADDCGCGFEDGSYCELAARSWFPYAATALAPYRKAIAALPDVLVFTHAGRRYGVLHGGLPDVARYLWPASPEDEFLHEIRLLENEIGALDGVVAGHCGVAFLRMLGDKIWINAGVIGMPPHDARCQTRFVLLDNTGPRIERLEYDFEGAARQMQVQGLDQGYDISLKTGLWPSEDILPSSMRQS